VVTRINESDEPFVNPATGMVVVVDVEDLMSSNFRHSGCQQYVRCDGATKSGAMWWGRWLNTKVFEPYAHDLASPLNDPQNLTHLMYDVSAVRLSDALSDDCTARLIAAEVVKGVALAASPAAAEAEAAVAVALRVQLAEAARSEAEVAHLAVARAEGHVQALTAVPQLGVRGGGDGGGAGGSA
jgi:hypothetical protein